MTACKLGFLWLGNCRVAESRQTSVPYLEEELQVYINSVGVWHFGPEMGSFAVLLGYVA
jgi:hypothetical protein